MMIMMMMMVNLRKTCNFDWGDFFFCRM
jgi:hypothetical protein